MNRIAFAIALCVFFIVSAVHSDNATQRKDSTASDALTIESVSLFCAVDSPIHGIAFDNQELMYVGGREKIYSITRDKNVSHFVTLDDTTENTIIWSLRFGPDRCLYVAAKDRVVRVTPGGEQTVVIREDFPGPCGVTDLRFDKNGDVFIVYDNKVTRYDSNYQKQDVIDGSQFEPPLEWIVGIEFSSDFSKLYLGDCRGKQAYIIPYLTKDHIKNSGSFPTNWGQYFAQDESGNVYLTSLGDDPTWPEFVVFTPEGKRADVYCVNRVPQSRGNHKKAMAWGQKGFNEDAIYCIIGNRIYEYDLENVTSSRRSLNHD